MRREVLPSAWSPRTTMIVFAILFVLYVWLFQPIGD